MSKFDSFWHGQVEIFKTSRSKNWQLRFYTPEGVRRQRSAGTTLKTDAIKKAERISADLVNRELKIVDGKVLLRDLFDKYLSGQRGKKYETLKRIRSTKTVFFEWLNNVEERTGLKAMHLTVETLERFQDYRVDVAGVSKRTVDNDIRNIFTVFAWGQRKNLVADNPADYSKTGAIQLYKPQSQNRDVYSDDEVKSLISTAKDTGKELYADMIAVFADTGMRFQELSNLTEECLSFTEAGGYITIRAHDGWSPKDPKEIKKVPMTPAVLSIMKQRIKDSEKYLFSDVDHPTLEQVALKHLKAIQKKAEINTKNRRLHWHTFRRYFIKKCMESGVSLNVLMTWSGHDSVSLALEYATSDVTDSFREISKIL